MRRKLATVALVGTLGLTGGALLGPGLAGAADEATGGRISVLTDALSGLVKDGTLTQTQADKVATRLDSALPQRGMHVPGRHRGPGAAHLSPETVAGVLGIPVDELRTAHQAGKTLAQIAADEGIAKDVLVDRLVAAAEKQLATAVADGRLTQAQADARKATLRERITERVDSTRPQHGPGHRGRGHEMRPPAPDDDATTAPSSFEDASTA